MKLKRVTSLLLAIILCVSLFTLTAFAEDGPGGNEEGAVAPAEVEQEEGNEEETEEEVVIEESSYEVAEADLLAAAPEETYTVYVYVAGKNDDGETLSADCLGFLGIDPNTLDKEGYFPVGEIKLTNYLEVMGYSSVSAVPESQGLITDDEIWAAIVKDLQTSLNPNNLETAYKGNAHSYLTNFVSEAIVMYNSTGGDGQSTMLCRKDNAYLGSYGFSNERDYDHLFHLDLCFNTKTIEFVLGNNDLDNDRDTIESRTYIENCTIQEPNRFDEVIPTHYYWDGKYYADADFTTEWDGIGTDITENQTVYIRLVGEDQVGINYVIADGEGELSITTESLYKDETAVGCTATPAEGYHFVGWYSDAECQVSADEDNMINPATPESGFATYYAKFEKDAEPEPEPTPTPTDPEEKKDEEEEPTEPSEEPSEEPTEPAEEPDTEPTDEPSEEPTDDPSEEPDVTPTPSPVDPAPTPIYPVDPVPTPSRPVETEEPDTPLPEVNEEPTIETPIEETSEPTEEPSEEPITIIEDPDTPLNDLPEEVQVVETTEVTIPTATIEETSVPLGDMPEEIEVEVEETPTESLPQTGHGWLAAIVLAAAGFGLLGLGLKRAKDESEEEYEE